MKVESGVVPPTSCAKRRSPPEPRFISSELEPSRALEKVMFDALDEVSRTSGLSTVAVEAKEMLPLDVMLPPREDVPEPV